MCPLPRAANTLLFRYLQWSEISIRGSVGPQALHLQNRKYRGRVTELVLVFLNSNVVCAVVHMDGPVLRSQPHRRLRRIVLLLTPLSQFSASFNI